MWVNNELTDHFSDYNCFSSGVENIMSLCTIFCYRQFSTNIWRQSAWTWNCTKKRDKRHDKIRPLVHCVRIYYDNDANECALLSRWPFKKYHFTKLVIKHAKALIVIRDEKRSNAIRDQFSKDPNEIGLQLEKQTQIARWVDLIEHCDQLAPMICFHYWENLQWYSPNWNKSKIRVIFKWSSVDLFEWNVKCSDEYQHFTSDLCVSKPWWWY